MIIVTGGAGFIGSNIAQELSKTNKVVICDKLNDPAKKKNISSIKGIKIIKIEEIFSFVQKIRKKYLLLFIWVQLVQQMKKI